MIIHPKQGCTTCALLIREFLVPLGFLGVSLTGGFGSSRCPCMAFDPVPATVTVGPNLLQHVQDPHLPAGLALIQLGVDDVVEGGAGSGFGLPTAAWRCSAGCGFCGPAATRGFVQDLDQQGDAAGLPHGDAAVLRAGQGQQRARHLLLISVGEHGEQPEDHLHLEGGPQ